MCTRGQWVRDVSAFRVLVLNMPTLLSDLISGAMANHSDIEILHEVDLAPLESKRESPDVVIVGRAESHGDYAASVLLARWPQSLVVAIASGGRGVLMYELKPMKMPVGDLSPNELVDAIRAKVRRPHRFDLTRKRRADKGASRA